MASSSGNIKFGKTYFVRPTGVHKATIIWLHDVESTGYYSHTALGRLKHPNIKWICPTAPKRPVTSLGGEVTTAFMKGLGGVGLGAAQALYYTSCYAFGWVPISPQIVIGINGWLPGWRSLEYNMCNTNFGTANRAATSRILLMHGTSDDVIPSAFGYKCADSLRMSGFPTLFKQCGGSSKHRLIQ
ncbi:hypothetical protein ARALYDRAFT_892284 [Arabidopsis lyrata subsp. lyrata]|uniref:Phospholipase/carboxylesterase/thioesterase domain-containing protein n=1 Tax=Arabidopsis lyrata subsp. lyrata TaxID=81972 RepID=D7KJJ9_ARALL|nr:hypothetical protein ARALYDRAFT_892284 [Arabidopsis lyrata subsp. lyrata]